MTKINCWLSNIVWMGDRIGCQTPNDVASDGGCDRLYVRVRIFSTNTSYYLHTFRYIIYTYIDI